MAAKLGTGEDISIYSCFRGACLYYFVTTEKIKCGEVK